MTAYSVTRPEDQDRTNGVVVVIPSRAELVAENRKLRTDNDVLRAQLAEARRDADRWAGEHALRLTVHERLDKAARVFAVLGHVYPEIRAVLGRAREDIWR